MPLQRRYTFAAKAGRALLDHAGQHGRDRTGPHGEMANEYSSLHPDMPPRHDAAAGRNIGDSSQVERSRLRQLPTEAAAMRLTARDRRGSAASA